MLRGLELRRDSEGALTSNTAKVGTVTPRPGGAATYITNVSLGATGTAPAGDGSDAAVPGTSRVLDTIAHINEALLQAHNAGGKPMYMYMTPALVQAWSAIPDSNAGGATQTTNMVNQTNSGPLTSVGAVAGWWSDFGRLEVVSSRHMLAGTILGMDPNYFSKGFTNGGEMYTKQLGDVGASKKFAVINQMTLEMTANAHFAVHALTAS